MLGECICVLRFRGKARDSDTCTTISELLGVTDTSLEWFCNMRVCTDVSVIVLNFTFS